VRLVEPEGERYWEAWREGAAVHTVSGAEGGKPRAARKLFPDEEQAEKDLQAKLRAKFREGLVFKEPENAPGDWRLALMVQVSRVHTGFYSLDYRALEGLIAVGRPNQTTSTPPCELLLMEGRAGSLSATIPLKAPDLWQVRFDPRGQEIYAHADGRVARVNPATGARTPLFLTPPFTFLPFALSGDGGRLLGSDQRQLVVIDVESGERLLERPLEEQRDHRLSRAAALSASGHLAALCEEPGKVELFDLRTGTRRTLTGDFPSAAKLVIHPSERYLLLREHYADWALRVFDLDTGAEVPRFRPATQWPCHQVDVSGDGTLLARGDGYTVFIHDFETGAVLAELRQEFAVRANGFALTFAGTNDTLLTRVDLGIVSLYRRGVS
jgi:hypothetical protein